MELVRTNKYRLYPTSKQKALLYEMFGMYRFAYNNLLGKIKDGKFGTTIIKNGKNKGKEVNQIPSRTVLIGSSTSLKKEYPFMSKLPNDIIQASLNNLYSGTKGFYNGGGYPKFKSKKAAKQTFHHIAGSRIKIKDNFIHLPFSNKSYDKSDHVIKFKKHKTNFDIDKITNISIEKDDLGFYWINITFKFEFINTRKKTNKEVGIDLGLKDMIICSDGFIVKNHNLTKKYARGLKLAQRKLSKKVKGSNNRLKQKRKVNKIHTKITNTRKDINHKVSRTLINLYDFIGLESLNIKGMVQNRKLSKAISNISWGDLVQKITYKGDENQVPISKIDTFFPSSKLCNKCGSIKDTLLLSDRIYQCNNCGYEEDRDINASKNILKEAKRIYSLKTG